MQTFNPNHQLMKKIIKNDFLGMFNEQLNQRFTFEYPPYSRLIKLTLKHKNLNILQKSSIWLADTLKNKFINQLLGPESPIVSRVNNQFIKNILIKVPVNTNLNNSKRYISKVLKIDLQQAENIKIDFEKIKNFLIINIFPKSFCKK